MHRFAPVALATVLAATVPARPQAATPFTVPAAIGHFTDPANLAGERVRPRDGRELPIDGGLGPDGKPDTSLGLAQMLRKLNTRASLMLIVAHPDDEDGGMLTYYSRGLGARVAILTLNRGEGGQNQMTGDFEDALGLLRTQELLAADRYMGVDQMFGTEVDFGFTKTKAEAFQKWNHERVLYDAVRAVRIYRPLVIASVFEGAVTDGHGQHQVAGQIAQEVFKAAGDPNVFPELTKEGILPWQPLKVYARVPFSRVTDKGLYDYATGQIVPAEFTNYVTGQTFTTEPTADVTIHEGDTDPLLTTCAANASDLPPGLSSRSGAEGSASASPAATDCHPLSYVQFARIGLGLQRSQIGGSMRVPPPGRVEVSYHLYGSRVCAPNFANPTPNLCSTNTTAAASTGQAPTARFIQALGTGPDTNPALANQPSFFDGIDVSLAGISSLAPDAKKAVPLALKTNLAGISQKIESARKEVSDGHTDYAANDLAAALKLVDMAIENLSRLNPDVLPSVEKDDVLHELRIKRAQLNDALALALGLSMEATANSADLPAHRDASATAVLTERSPLHLQYVRGWSENSARNGIGDGSSGDGAPIWSISNDHALTRECGLPGGDVQITRPYFTRRSIEQPVYDLLTPVMRNAPATPPAFTCWAQLNYQGADVRIGAVVRHDSQPVQIIPAIDLHVVDGPDLHSVHARVLRNDVTSTQVSLFHEPTDAKLAGQTMTDSGAWQTHIAISDTTTPGETRFEIRAPRTPRVAVTLTGSATALDGTEYTEGFQPIGYGSLPRTDYYTPATLRVVPVDLKLPPENKRHIAYLPGTGDDVPAALASIGLTPTILKVSDLTPPNLSKFDTVVLGVRTYNAHPDLHGAPTQALLDFARNGGNVVVQYQTPEFTAADAPYPLVDRNERVIDETAPVTLLTADSSKPKSEQNPAAEALLTTPNKITSADFNGWIEERGHGFLDTWDPHYTALTETHDPGAPAEHILPQAPQRGGLITVQLGKGRWTYVAFALYRQLPEAVPGAFRLFVNLLNP